MTHINQRRDTSANWTATDPVLQLGEVGWETNTLKAKIGNGSSVWSALSYAIDFSIYATLASPALTGNPTAPTQLPGNNSTRLATTAFVTAAIAAANTALLAGTITDGDTTHAPTVEAVYEALLLKANLASPTFSGTPSLPTGTTGVLQAATDDSTKLATTSFVKDVVLTASATLDFPSIAAQTATAITFQSLTITVTGAAVGDAVSIGPPSGINAGLIWEGYVSATNTVTVRVGNCTAAPIDPASATWKATVFKA